jgi:hypothetical protein
MRHLYKNAFGFIAVMFLITCKKDQAAAESNIPATVEQTKKLLVGDWIEDSIIIEYAINVPCISPSYLNVNSTLNYRMVETVRSSNPATPFDGTDTGQFTNIGTRYITPTSFDSNNNFLGEFGRMQIDTLTEHRLVLFGYEVLGTPPILYFHK